MNQVVQLADGLAGQGNHAQLHRRDVFPKEFPHQSLELGAMPPPAHRFLGDVQCLGDLPTLLTLDEKSRCENLLGTKLADHHSR